MSDVSCPMVISSRQTSAAADGERQRRRERQREADCGLERRLPLLRVEARVARRLGAAVELARRALLLPERAQRPHRGDGLLDVLVHA